MAGAPLRLVVGLGNPGKEYAHTRHNLGFMAVTRLAERAGFKLAKEAKFEGWTARGFFTGPGGERSELHLLLPSTYMNLSGRAVARYLNWFKMGVEELIVVCDDIALAFGEMRMRLNGSCGGHNGLRDIESALGSSSYARLRIGIGDRERGDLSDYVLSRFTPEEEEKLDGLLDEAAGVVESAIWEGAESVMERVNRRLKKENE